VRPEFRAQPGVAPLAAARRRERCERALGHRKIELAGARCGGICGREGAAQGGLRKRGWNVGRVKGVREEWGNLLKWEDNREGRSILAAIEFSNFIRASSQKVCGHFNWGGMDIVHFCDGF
jgi:hypothetical protein